MSDNKMAGSAGPGFKEFVTLIALLTSLVALAIDAMLPALAHIGQDFNVSDPNDVQLIIGMIFAGMAIGQLFYGPLSDNLGRKPAIFIGLGLFIVGDLIALMASDFNTLLLGRLIQGIGLASPRVVGMALVRDLYVGAGMARVMSFIMTVFILVPVIAPGLGQLVLLVSDWHMIFVLFLVLALVLSIWFGLRMPETLADENRRPLNPGYILRACKEVLTHPVAMGYTLISGFVFGAFISYLSLAQPILQQQYQLGDLFVFYFGALAASIGISSLVNARLVGRFGMQRLVLFALITITLLSLTYLLVVHWYSGQPPLWSLMLYLFLVFFVVGLLFGNLNALAMEPLGHIAGIGAGLVSSVSTMLGVVLGVIIGQLYNNTLYPLVIGYFVVSGIGWLLCYGLNRRYRSA